MKNSELKISNGFILIENAKKRVLINISNIAEIRETENGGTEISTTTHEGSFTIKESFNTVAIKLGFYND
ncbi:hypothetical protein LNJ08_12745 [Tenacibaculum finnmarkense genomovar ulcerans]|uniref:hypothetical protein n=1 Tax=Tenacibaculum finnmarkense TaxID=2781243 RepID=UPI001E4D0E4D|nr:hypothetical protein [Tenacibaculum finnmarkense]MCD8455258.1 hypothetical protein [Tenacibaculum finnmarkense genomovar ulcerans]